MGYYRNVGSFNVGKVSEFKERVFYKVKNTEYYASWTWPSYWIVRVPIFYTL